MGNHNIFEVRGIKYAYLTQYKQLFNITGLKYSDEKSLIEQLSNHVNTIDRHPIHSGNGETQSGLFLCIANTCNAACNYCFANQGDYGKDRGLMDEDTMRRAVDIFLGNASYEVAANIIFFGGEPLLAYPIIMKSVSYITKVYPKRQVRYSVVTNGTLLTKEMIDFFSKNNFSVAVSLDGGEAVHNSQRPLRNGANSYKEATKNIRYLLDTIPNTHARGTYANFQEDYVQIHEDLLTLGFEEVNIPPDILGMKKEDIEILKQRLNEFHDFVVDNIDDLAFPRLPFGVLIDRIRKIFQPKITFEYGCSMGNSILAIDKNGDIYPCHRFISIDNTKLGNVLYNELSECKKHSSDQCKNCWNRYTCSHGCAYNDYVLSPQSGVKNMYWCEYSKKLTEICLSMVHSIPKPALKKILGLKESICGVNND